VEGSDEFAEMVLRWWTSQSGGTHPRPIDCRGLGAEKKVFAGCGHLVNLEQPEEFYSVVADFLDEREYPSEG
jgi:pimeloyl-ACP methyl ester carboxylesterase